MNSWFYKSLGDGMWASIPSAEIEELFLPIFESTGKLAEMAVFTRYESGQLHCEVFAYFSPAAAEVANNLGALPCEKPSRDGLNLLAGDQSCWSVLFP